MDNYISSKCHFAFNIWDINSAQAVIDAAQEVNKDIIIQTSAKVYSTIPHKQLREFVTGYTQNKNINVWLHLDHCKDIELIRDAVDNGWDIVMIDASDKPVSENIRITNQITRYAHDRNVMVEAEVGHVGGVKDKKNDISENIAKKSDILRFVKETDVDFIAVAFGNVHGIYQGESHFHYDLIEYTAGITSIPFVVHGGSGLANEVLMKLMEYKTIKKINISTDVKRAYRKGIQNAYQDGAFQEDDFQATRIEQYIHNAIMTMAEEKLRLLDRS